MQPKTQYMERFIMQDLIAWKNREDRKPLILLGARQVGKTYILKEFGQREFENVAYITVTTMPWLRICLLQTII